MIQGLRDLDSILRGDATRLDALRGEDGADGDLRLPAKRLVPVLLGLGLAYGLCMGSYSLFRTYLSPEETVVGVAGAWSQLLASMVKVPLLFVLTLLVTTPSLYVFNALCGSRLRFASMLKLLVAMLGVTLAVLAALGPIAAFFGVTSTSYAFMKLLNVAFFATAGFIGLTFLLRTLHRLVRVQGEQEERPVATPAPAPASAPPGVAADEDAEEVERAAAGLGVKRAVGSPPPPPDNAVTHAQQAAERAARLRGLGASAALGKTDPVTDRRAQTVFNCWLILFGLVGAQMSWVLRPFIGNPDQPFTLLRDREGNFFADVLGALFTLLGG